MNSWFDWLLAILLFLVGLRLSAFFSGSETGFYRISFLRVSMAAHRGDRAAQRIMWFAQNPVYFVATTLVGNNVANYLITVAVTMAATTLAFGDSGWAEIVCTLLVSPVIFLFGELLPKNLYYRAPLYLLSRGSLWFLFFYRLFLVVSWPLILLSRFFQRWSDPGEKPLALALGRTRLVQVLKRGHEEGLLTDVQSRLVNGLMQTAPLPVLQSVTPASRILGIDDNTPREAALDFARRFGIPNIAVRHVGQQDGWYGYVRVVDLATTTRSLLSLVRPMPRIEASVSKLETLLQLRHATAPFGVVVREGRIIGTVNEHGLIEQLFRSPQAITTAMAGA